MTPSRHRQALLTWLLVYPVITLLSAVLEPTLRGVPMPLRTLVLSGLMAPIMVYLAMPWATRVLVRWSAERA